MNILDKSTHPIFKDFTLAELNQLLKIAKIAVFSAGDVLIHEGDVSRIVYIILSGKVSVDKESAIKGEFINLARLGANSVLGEISVITNNPRSATVKAISETKALMLDISELEKDNSATPILDKLRHNLTEELTKKLVYSKDKLVKYDTEAEAEANLVEDQTIYKPNSILLLFGWKWIDIMYEVPFLAQHGYDAIKVFPPSEFVLRKGKPWWAIYQPVTYELSSFYGTKEDFIKMIDFCHTFKIKVYVDLILNHMADYSEGEAEHIGTNGHTFGKYHYGPLNKDNDFYEYDDFFHFAEAGNKDISMEDYSKLDTVWHLEHYDLANLPALNIDNSHVVKILRKYVKEFLALGVDGFRIDAAKHLRIPQVEKILENLHTNDGLKPFIYQEYYEGSPLGAETYFYMEKYFRVGFVTSFTYGQFLTDAILKKTNNLEKLVSFSFGSSWINYPENRTVVVLDNHDTERMMPSILSYKDTKNNAYVLAYVFLLAWPFGVPKIMSSFKFTGMDDSIPETAIWQNGRNTCLDKNSPWVSQHRWSAISNMVLFRNKTKQAQGISHIWLNGDQIAFARTVQKSREYVTTLGFVVINNTDQPLKKRFETGLPAGKYFNLVMSQFNKDGKMEGVTVDVENYGFSTIEVMPYNAVVLLLNYLI